MQFGHLPAALSIATYDWSPETAVFCIAMHWLPNIDSLMVKGGLDKPAIRGAIRFERLLRGKNPLAPIEKHELEDPFWVDDGGFHCTVTHSLFFALLVGTVLALFSPHYALLGAIAVAAHYAADIGSTVGLPLLWPLTRRKYSLRLFKDTGWWGKEMFIGYYKQPMSWVLEGGVTIFFVYRLMMIYG